MKRTTTSSTSKPQPRREWTPGQYTPMYSDRPDGNYSAILANALGTSAHWILEPTKIRGGICLGSQEGAGEHNLENLQNDNVGLIINATPRYPNFHESVDKISYVRVNVHDEPSANLSPWFEGISERIEKALSSNVSVFVHCQMGISRSSTLVMAYLMRYQSTTLHDAYRHTKEKRPKVEPNIGFWKQLLAYEKKLLTNCANTPTEATEAKSSHDAEDSSAPPAAVTSMLAYLHDPTSEAALEQSMIDVACMGNVDSLASMFQTQQEVVRWKTTKPREEIVEQAMNKVYDSITDDRLVWLVHVVNICDAHAHALSMLEEDSEYMADFWAGEWSSEKANKMIDAINNSQKEKEHVTHEL